MSAMFRGIPVRISPFAVAVRWEIQRHPIRKRRRNWRPMRVERPSVYIAIGTLFVHPELFDKLEREHAWDKGTPEYDAINARR